VSGPDACNSGDGNDSGDWSADGEFRESTNRNVIEEVNLDPKSKWREMNDIEARKGFESMNDSETPKSREWKNCCENGKESDTGTIADEVNENDDL
jgi:hypothetical protein